MTRKQTIRELKIQFVGEYDRQREAKDMAIKALEQESILDKIRAEIAELDIYYDNYYFSDNRDAMFKCNEILRVLDKYRGESEE